MYVSSHLDTDSPACPSPWNTTDKTRHIVSSVIPSKTHTLAIYNRTYSHLLLELRGEKACDDWWWMREREKSPTVSCIVYLFPIATPSIAISSFRGVRSRCRARGHAILLRENSKYVYIYICNVWNSGTESYKRADRGRNSDEKDNVEEFTFRSWYIVSNKIKSRFCQILPPRVCCFFFLFYFYVRQSLAIIQSRRVWTAVNHVTN